MKNLRKRVLKLEFTNPKESEMPKEVKAYIESLPCIMSKRINDFISTHQTMDVHDVKTVQRIWGIVTLNEQQYWELTQLLK